MSVLKDHTLLDDQNIRNAKQKQSGAVKKGMAKQSRIKSIVKL